METRIHRPLTYGAQRRAEQVMISRGVLATQTQPHRESRNKSQPIEPRSGQRSQLLCTPSCARKRTRCCLSQPASAIVDHDRHWYVVSRQGMHARTSSDLGACLRSQASTASANSASRRPATNFAGHAPPALSLAPRRMPAQLRSASTDSHRSFNRHCRGPSCSAGLRSGCAAVPPAASVGAFASA